MTIFKCSICKYKTTNKGHLNRHFKSKKHINKSSTIDNIIDEHTGDFNNRSISDLIEIITKMDKANKKNILEHKKEIKRIENKYLKLLKEKDETNQKILDSILDKSVLNTINNTNTSTNIHNYIINNVRPQTNVKIELDKPLTEDEIKLIDENNPLDGTYLFIYGRLIKDRTEKDKLLICYDFSRKKFSFFGEENNWVDDIGLKKFKNMIYEKINNCYVRVHKDQNNLSNEEQLKLMDEFLTRYRDFEDLFKGDRNNKIISKLYDNIKINNNFIKNHNIIISEIEN
jgi:hypothetical protein